MSSTKYVPIPERTHLDIFIFSDKKGKELFTCRAIGLLDAHEKFLNYIKGTSQAYTLSKEKLLVYRAEVPGEQFILVPL